MTFSSITSDPNRSATPEVTGPLRPTAGRTPKRTARFWPAALPGLMLLLLLRVAVINSAVVVEDHDSIKYLTEIGVLSGRLPREMYSFNADRLPLFPFSASLLARTGMELETAARCTSLLFTVVAFLSLLGIAHLWAGPAVVCATGVLLAVTWRLLYYDTGILTEPAYLGLVYLGLFFYARKYAEGGSLLSAALLGLVFGAAFLARAEGIMFAVLIPGLHAAVMLQSGRLPSGAGRWAAWSMAYVMGFAIAAGPHIASVSRQMGRLAINGRQAWWIARNAPGEASDPQRLWGLDHSPAIVNLDYLRQHPEAAAGLRAQDSTIHKVRTYTKRIAGNAVTFARVEFYKMLGPVSILLFGVGLFRMVGARRYGPFSVLLTFVVLLLGPIFMQDADPRHLLVVVPMLLLVTAIGLEHFARKLRLVALRRLPAPLAQPAAIGGGLLLVAASNAYPIYLKIVRPPDYTAEYSPHDMRPFVKRIRGAHPPERVATVLTGKRYIAYLSRSRMLIRPWTDYEGLVRYARLNHADFFYWQENIDGAYPFTQKLRAGTEEFQLVHAGPMGRTRAALYRFVDANIQDAAQAAEAPAKPQLRRSVALPRAEIAKPG